MKKVILVDDELFVRKGLIELIRWGDLGFQIVAEAEDGEEALSLISEHSPDLVLTDIKMPVMDGLSLIAAVQESEEPAPEFIILSGYNDFTYAQRALRFGVQDFILKPIDEDELTCTLQRMNQRWSQSEETEYKAQLKGEAALNALLFEQREELQTADLAQALGLQESEPSCYCILERNSCREEVEAPSLREWKSFISNILARVGGSVSIFHDLSPYTFGFLLTGDHLRDRLERFRDQITSQLLRNTGQEEASEIRIYVGEMVQTPLDLKISYEGAREAMLGKYALDDFYVITQEMARKASLSFRDLETSVYSSLQEYVEENNIPALSEVVTRIKDDFKKFAFTSDAVLASISKCGMCVLDAIRKINVDEEPTIHSRTIMMQWNRAPRTLSLLMEELMIFLIESADQMEELCKSKTTGNIHKVRQYIESHYQEEITLKIISKRFFMNPVYLGQLFKNTYGTYFNDFLLHLRIQEAKRLLRQTDQKIYEIAEQVGFSSPEYFIKQFEKVEGHSPTEYKLAVHTKKS